MAGCVEGERSQVSSVKIEMKPKRESGESTGEREIAESATQAPGRGANRTHFIRFHPGRFGPAQAEGKPWRRRRRNNRRNNRKGHVLVVFYGR
jgi:hypothetical protein